MGYDCSVTKRRGCNYCLRSKNIEGHCFSFVISDRNIEMEYDNSEIAAHNSEEFEINYCPI